MPAARLRLLIAAVLALCLALWGTGTANASFLLDPPSSSVTLAESPDLDARVWSRADKAVKQDIHAASRQEWKYGTGVLLGGQPEMGTMNVFTPTAPNGTVVAYAPPTDSLSPWDAPSRKINKGGLGAGDVAYINALLDAGYTVLVIDAYGEEHPQYAGTMNGVRIVNGIEAYRQETGNTTEPTWCYGFSGGGIDCARVTGYQHAANINVVIDSGPTDLPAFLRDPGVQNGLGWLAAVGLVSSLTDEQVASLYPTLRPSVIVGIKLLRAASDVLPIGGLTQTIMTLSGVFFPLPLASVFRLSAQLDPNVALLLSSLNPSTLAGFDGDIIKRCNAADIFVPCQVHGATFANESDAPLITNHGGTAPGHAMMPIDQLLALLAGPLPTADSDTYGPTMRTIEKVIHTIVSGVAFGLSVYGYGLAVLAPLVLEPLDLAITVADRTIDVLAGKKTLTEAVFGKPKSPAQLQGITSDARSAASAPGTGEPQGATLGDLATSGSLRQAPAPALSEQPTQMAPSQPSRSAPSWAVPAQPGPSAIAPVPHSDNDVTGNPDAFGTSPSTAGAEPALTS
ncbi:MAG: hypothetical protein WAW85_06460 [Gordonia sp. (in: high G+C Gram-positive bacteria)]|uniref:hypothetical protein n=1 Tax=Gordonia sp. (in: high G+C Gram-positive bacteria) TaxID=84139 RepID=UPI003BB6E897